MDGVQYTIDEFGVCRIIKGVEIKVSRKTFLGKEYTETLERIPRTYFYGRLDISELIIPDREFIIEEYAFGQCPNLQQVTFLGKSIVCSHAFVECHNLKMLDMHLSSQMEAQAFADTGLEGVALPIGSNSTFCTAFDSDVAIDYKLTTEESQAAAKKIKTIFRGRAKKDINKD